MQHRTTLNMIRRSFFGRSPRTSSADELLDVALSFLCPVFMSSKLGRKMEPKGRSRGTATDYGSIAGVGHILGNTTATFFFSTPAWRKGCGGAGWCGRGGDGAAHVFQVLNSGLLGS